MNDINKNLENWLNDLNEFNFKEHQNLTNIEFYMDQVVKIINNQFRIFTTSSVEKIITPSMINNYVKSDIIPSPNVKKYTKEHIAAIEEVCLLKEVLSIAEVKQILDETYRKSDDKNVSFADFDKMNTEKTNAAVEEVFKKLNDVDQNNTEQLANLALDCALTASAYISIAKRILFYNKIYEFNQKQKKEMEKNNSKQEA